MSDINSSPIISIVMASYMPRIEFLVKSLESIKQQTFKNFELVFVDDGCSEQALSLVNSYSSFFDIIIIRNETNLGLPRSLNKGIKAARGSYIARFDDDDMMSPNRLQEQYNYMKMHPEFAGCWSEFFYIDNNDREINKSHIQRTDFLKTFLAKGNCCCHSSLFLKTTVLEEIGLYNEKFLYAQDLELYLRILSVYKMGCVQDYLVSFRVNTTRNPLDKQILSFVFSYSAALKYIHLSKSPKMKWYLFIRIITMIKFSVFDLSRIEDI